MKRFVEGEDRRQATLLPECLDDYVAEDNPVRVVEAFTGELDLAALGFAGVVPEATGRPAYHPAGVLPYVPKTQTSSNTNRGLFTGQDFVYDAEHDLYTCPAGQHLTKGKVRSDRREPIHH